MSESVASSKEPSPQTAPSLPFHDENNFSPPSAEIPVQPGGSSEGGSGADKGNKILNAVGSVFAKYGVNFKPGRGRPKKDGSPKISDKPLAIGPAPQASPPLDVPPVSPAPQPSIDEAFAQECIEGIFRGFISVRDAGVLRMAVRISGNPQWSKDQIGRVSPTDQEIKSVCRNIIIVLKKYNIRLDFLPEISLLASLIRMEMRYRSFMGELKDMLTERERKEQAAQANPELKKAV